MENERDELSKIKDVGYLLTLLRVAKKKKDTDMKDSIITRLEEMGVLHEVEKLA